jgi:hypothetical protein
MIFAIIPICMVTELRQLTANELELVYKAPILVCILIAGADGEIDRKEVRESIRFAEESRSGSNKSISMLFREIAEDFEDKLRVVLQQYPYDSAQRNPLLTEELALLNAVWPKMDQQFAIEFYQTLLEIAHKIASSSGGMLGYRTVAEEEARFLNLDMIKNPSPR